uniref:Uncharacterized protein n=1 Tax=Cyprinus carpio TaxID=7962 RepID=A0A8C2FA22_CYPCA
PKHTKPLPAVHHNDLQGTDGSGFLGGLDVRRQIPIKLLSKQTERDKLPARPQRPSTRLPSKSEEGWCAEE